MRMSLALRPLHSLKIDIPFQAILLNCALIMSGSVIFVLGIHSLLVPQHLLSGGVVGIALIFHYLYPSVDVGLAYLLINIPLMALAWFYVGRRFMAYSLFGMLFFSFAAHVLKTPPIVISDPILGALLAGIMCGLGGGIVLRSLGSAGGLDIVAVFLNKRFGLRTGVVVNSANCTVLLAGCYLFGLERTLYSVIYVYASSRVIDSILSGFNRRKVVFVVSERAREIARDILRKANRGVTFLKGEGAYTGRRREVIFTVAALTELPKLKDLIFDLDPDAFVVVNDTLEVLGKRHGKRRVY